MKIVDIRSNLLDHARCETCSVSDISLCAGMTDDEFSHLSLSIEDVNFSNGSALFRQGDRGLYIYSIRKGMVKLNRIRRNGDQRIMRILRPGDVVGLEVVVASQYEYDAVALESLITCRIPVKIIQQLDRESPRLHKKLLERWHQTVVDADEWMSELTSGSARARMARLLLKMRDPVEQGLSTLFSRDDIGSMLCMTMETASRTINAFQREGKIISLDAGGRYYQINSEALDAEIVGGD